MIRKWGEQNRDLIVVGCGIVAKLYQHRSDGTYYTKRQLGTVTLTWQVHPDGVSFLKQQSVVIGGDIPSYAMRILTDRNWLFTREEAGQWQEIDWAPAWESLGGAPAGHYRLWLSRQKRDSEALLMASRRHAESEQLAHHKEEDAARVSAKSSPAVGERSTWRRPAMSRGGSPATGTAMARIGNPAIGGEARRGPGSPRRSPVLKREA